MKIKMNNKVRLKVRWIVLCIFYTKKLLHRAKSFWIMVQPITRDPELKNPRTNSRQVSGLTDQHIKSRLPGSPVAAHPRMTSHSLITVTRSYRTYTCFPFNLRSYKTPSAPVVYYSISYRIPLFFQLYNSSGYFFIHKPHRGSRYKNNANSTLLSGAPTAASGTAPAIDHGISGAMTTALSSR